MAQPIRLRVILGEDDASRDTGLHTRIVPDSEDQFWTARRFSNSISRC